MYTKIAALSCDFIYIEDIFESILRIADVVSSANHTRQSYNGLPADNRATYRVFNIGNGCPVKLMRFIDALVKALGIEAIKNMMPMQDGDVYATRADTGELFKSTGYRPSTSIEQGDQEFVNWYKSYYKK